MKRRPIHCVVSELNIGDKIYLFDNLIYSLYDINIKSPTVIEIICRRYKGDKNTFTRTILSKDTMIRRYTGKNKNSYKSGFSHAIRLCIDYIDKKDKTKIGIDDFVSLYNTTQKNCEKWMSNE